MIHSLDIEHQYFKAIDLGIKTFELREQRPGRYFAVGDVLRLKDDVTGAVIHATVRYILNGFTIGMKPNWCCMSITVNANGRGVKNDKG